MDNQPASGPQPDNSPKTDPAASPYDFFMNDPAQPKKSLLPGIGSMKGRLLMIVGGMIVLLIIVSIFSMLSSRGDERLLQLAGVGRQQNEVIRMADICAGKARILGIRNFCTTIQLALGSQQTTLQKALATQQVSVTSKSLDAKKKTRNDSKLTIAQQNNRYDDALLEILTTELTVYQQRLKLARDHAATSAFKTAMSQEYERVTDLISQIPER